jgi:UDP-N-acetylmuramate dehydrogenase
MRVRKRKLPDPGRIPSCGSFFKNPVVANAIARRLIDEHPELPNWPDRPDHTKLSAAWLIDQLGWRGHRRGGIEVFDRHALVLTNRGDGTGDDLLALAADITDSVRTRFGIDLEPEPVIIGKTD